MSKEKFSFASKSLGVHLLRGLIGGTAIWFAFVFYNTYPWASLLLLGVMILAFRGCPVCWSVGLYETSCDISKRRKQKQDNAG